MRHPSRLLRSTSPLRLYSTRLMMRPLAEQDFAQWTEVRVRNEEWLSRWEPRRREGSPDPTRDRSAFATRCNTRDRERSSDMAYPFGIFLDQLLVGEVNINNVVRGALQSASVGYWIDERQAGHSYIAEAVAAVTRFAFEQIRLHRLEICIVPRNLNSIKVVEKLEYRNEGLAERYLEIAGVWEDHLRFAITREEWDLRGEEISQRWLAG